MKKYNEGYALPFVLVVLVVMCIIAVGIMDFSLRNLQSQKATIQRMEAKYEAAGEIEKIYAAAINNTAGAKFDSSEKLFFSIVAGTLRVAAGGDDEGVWIIAELKPKDSEGQITSTFGEDGKPGTLTIRDAQIKSVDFSVYKVVDKETALAFLDQEGGS